MRLIRRALLALAAIALTLLCSAAAADAATPLENIPLGSEPSSCSSETSAECQHWAIERLDAARADLGLAAYALPSSFTSLSPDKQLLVLTDLDRSAYGYTPVYGLNTNLSEAAQAGVREARDPTVPAGGGPWKGYGSDWASTSALIGYYLWMYDDGYGSPNGDCRTPGAAGCWGHRKVILGEAVTLPEPQLMGAAAGITPRNAGSALIISADNTTNAYYTWTQAQEEGAGRHEEEPPPAPPESPAAEKPGTPPASPARGSTASTQPGGPSPSAGGTQRSEVLASSSALIAEITVRLGDHLLPSGRAARIAAILKHGAIMLTLPRGLRGRLVLDYYLGSTRRLLVARGSRHLNGSKELVVVTLTAAGRHLLRRRTRVALVVYARLVPAGSPAIDVSKHLLLTR